MSLQRRGQAEARSDHQFDKVARPIHEARALVNLPSEILALIVTQVETAKVLSHISQTCKRLRNFVEQIGFRVFVQTRFPYFNAPLLRSTSFWRDAAHGLTTLQRNWDRKAFIAWHVRPETNHDHGRQRRNPMSRQTMGFLPVIDSYENWYGGNWNSRKEVVVWGAGAGLVMRVKVMGRKASKMWAITTKDQRRSFNAHGQRIKWATHNDKKALEGRDDITTVNLLPQKNLIGCEQIIVGRASGDLTLVSLSTDDWHDVATTLASYETAGRSVRSATRTSNPSGWFAACLSDAAIALFSLDSSHEHVLPIGEVSAIPAGISGRTWSSRFLNQEKLAVGYGPSKEPIRVYDISSGEFTDRGVRSLPLNDLGSSTSLDTTTVNSSGITSIYSLAPIPSASLTGGSDGEVFLSGAYDGFARYALRSHLIKQ